MTHTKPLSPFPYYGGKARLIDFILPNIPPCRRFVDLFGGSGVVSFAMAQSTQYIVYNDIESRLVGFFRTLRDEPDALIEAIKTTPVARDEFDACWLPSEDPIEDARRVFVRIMQGFNAKGLWGRKGWKSATSTVTGCIWVNPFRERADILREVSLVLKQIAIENTDWRKLIRLGQAPETTLFADPPYDLSTRSSKAYGHEMTEDDHRELAQELAETPANAVICGYRSDLYDAIYADWRRIDYKADVRGVVGEQKRTESLWIKQ